MGKNRTRWEVAAAILLRENRSIHINELADMVVRTNLTRLGSQGATPSKTLRNQLNKNCPHPEWFQIYDNIVILAHVDRVAENPGVSSALKEITPVEMIPFFPEEVIDSEKLIEGAVKQILVNAYERNQVAREKCIQHYGPICVICRFHFAREFGPLARGFIHVHHLKPHASIGKSYVVDPITDLRPVCPNCHAMLHLGGTLRSIEFVQQLRLRNKIA